MCSSQGEVWSDTLQSEGNKQLIIINILRMHYSHSEMQIHKGLHIAHILCMLHNDACIERPREAAFTHFKHCATVR